MKNAELRMQIERQAAELPAVLILHSQFCILQSPQLIQGRLESSPFLGEESGPM